jgi:hypothetical protein
VHVWLASDARGQAGLRYGTVDIDISLSATRRVISTSGPSSGRGARGIGICHLAALRRLVLVASPALGGAVDSSQASPLFDRGG